jgi:hypothetical protein
MVAEVLPFIARRTHTSVTATVPWITLPLGSVPSVSAKYAASVTLGVSVPVNIFAKNQTDFNVSAAQPVTPLFSIYQLVKIARADENIAKVKAGLPVAETANKIEKNFFDLLVAQRELTSAKADAKQLTKAKVAAGVKSSYLELERSRKLYQLARRMVSATQLVEASYKSDNLEVESAQAKMEADMFRAELEYRQAYAKLKGLKGNK